ncbi:hypothetical protein [Nitrosospira sp. Nsp1]|uniref:hypothetical protein n=1 Tax=Nitrosospira sp. Nsp1 TaxID=136547 RepID=UPI00088965DF|nr:hypothetical protein [Nitrosospira sp. Nsp1]SCX50311.1 hypothetical protein SAMN05720354_10972 [Nitrosospira sp. Nsp1]
MADVLKLLTKWHPEDDPISREQADVLISIVGERLTESAMEGFLIVCCRFVDEYGNHRTSELENIFRTHTEAGKQALVASLEHVNSWVGGMEAYERNYPVTVNPSNPAFPLFKILKIENLAPSIFRILNSKGMVDPKESLIDYISRTGKLPAVPKQTEPVRRIKPDFHWCSYDKWESPEQTRNALQILSEWSDCQLRATIMTAGLGESCYVAFNGDKSDPADSKLRFYKYFYEPISQDHPEFEGGGLQIGVEGAPKVQLLELWDLDHGQWKVIWKR